MKRIYIAGKISGECETPELMEKCKEKFYSYSGSENIDFIDFASPEIRSYKGDDGNSYSHGLFINRHILGKAEWSDYMKNDLSVLLQCDEIHMLPDWKESRGAKIEHQLAVDLEITIKYINY